MSASFHERFPNFGLKDLGLNANEIEVLPLEDFLASFVNGLETQIEIIMKNLESYFDLDDEMRDLVRMIDVVEKLQIHLDFTLSVLKSESTEEVERLKKKFNDISKFYDQVKTRDDVALIPVKYTLVIFHDKMYLQLKKFVKKSFKKDSFGEVKLIKSTETLARIQIMINRYELADLHFPDIVNFPKDDIFCFPKTSPLWQELYQSATFKRVLTKQEVEASFKHFHIGLRLAHILFKRMSEFKDSSKLKIVSRLFFDVLYYGSQQAKAETQALLQFINPTMQEAFQAWNLTEHPILSTALQIFIPTIGYDDHIYVPRIFPRITREVILNEYKNNTFNKLQPMEESDLQAPDLSPVKEEVLEELFVKAENKIPVRILAPDHLSFRPNNSGIINKVITKTANLLNRSSTKTQQNKHDGAIIIHVHGGGFVSMSSATHRVYLNRWVKDLNIIHFSIDYRLAPENKYPDGLDDVWQAYLWIVNYAETILGIKNKKIILTGDSAGGNLIVALMLRLARAGYPTPHGCLLMYPCLYVDAMSCSPSYLTSLEDPMLPTSLLKLVAKAYVSEEFKNTEDPFISPIVASDELLQRLPPIRIVAGTDDPLFDDNWRFIFKLRKLKKDVKIIVHENIPHAFLCYPDLKNYGMFIEEAEELIKELVALDSKEN